MNLRILLELTLASQQSSLSTQLSQQLSKFSGVDSQALSSRQPRSLPISHHTVPRILLYSPNMLTTHILCNLLGKACCFPASLTIYTTIFNWFSVAFRLFSFFCVTRSASCYRFLFIPFIWLDFGYVQIIDLKLAAVASLWPAELSRSNGPRCYSMNLRRLQFHSLHRHYNTLHPHSTLIPLGPLFTMMTILGTHLSHLELLKR